MATKISWTEDTLNPIVGCTKTSPGCDRCYAITMAYRLEKMAIAFKKQGKNPGRLENYIGLTKKVGDRRDWSGIIRFAPEALEKPVKKKKPTLYFVDSMGDLFHALVEDEWLDEVFAMIVKTPQHRYQILTKRGQRMLRYLIQWIAKNGGVVPPNIRLGISVENQATWNERSPYLNALSQIGFKTMISFEPFLEKEAIDIETFDVDSAIAAGFATSGKNALFYGTDYLDNCLAILGGESGKNSRKSYLNAIRDMGKKCSDAGMTVYIKQMGENPPLSAVGVCQ